MGKQKPQLMAILNLTPDSFSDGGKYRHIDDALKACEQMLLEGADIIDIGGESTRPGASQVSVQEEIDRVIPVLDALRQRFDCRISVDTSKPSVMREALRLKVNMINDVRALRELSDAGFLADADCDICLMHMQGQPGFMQEQPAYTCVVDEVKQFLAERIVWCQSVGIAHERLVIDPGFGFGKNLQHNLQLLNQLERFHELACPVLVGVSRKSMIGTVLGRELDGRLIGSVAALSIAVGNGAGYVRVHDVAASRDALDMVWAIINEGIDE